MKTDHKLPHIPTWVKTEWFNLYSRFLAASHRLWIGCFFCTAWDKLQSVSKESIFFFFLQWQ